jgi:hypothetical protein
MTDRGILYDMDRIHGRSKPSRDLLLRVALVVARVSDLTLGRQEKRLRELLVGWLNEHYEYVEPLIGSMILRDSTGGLSGPVHLVREYRAQHPEETDLLALLGPGLDE